jgi:hypothetical protein
MGFSLLVEVLNLRVRARTAHKPVKLHQRYTDGAKSPGEEAAPPAKA